MEADKTARARAMTRDKLLLLLYLSLRRAFPLTLFTWDILLSSRQRAAKRRRRCRFVFAVTDRLFDLKI